MIFQTLFWLLLQIIKILADDKSPKVDCLYGVYTAIGKYTFAGDDADDYWRTAYQNPVRVLSLYASGTLTVAKLSLMLVSSTWVDGVSNMETWNFCPFLTLVIISLVLFLRVTLP
jgi:hypothetical protein